MERCYSLRDGADVLPVTGEISKRRESVPPQISAAT